MAGMDAVDSAVDPLELAIVIAVLAAAALVRAHAPLGDEPLRRWADAHGLELNTENRPPVERYLRLARILRTWGAIVGLLAPTVIRPLLGEPVHVAGIGAYEMTPGELGLVFVGYLAGAVCAEVAVSRPFDPARRSAALLPRELTDYLPRRVVRLQRGLAAACVLGAGALPLVPSGPNALTTAWGAVAVFSAIVVGAAAGLERLELWVVQRAQPFVSEPLLAADDAIRAQSVHSLAGAGIAFLCFTCSLIAFALAMSDVGLLRQTMPVVGVVTLLCAITACPYYGDRAWRVRRTGRRSAPTAQA
jgi:hypothetical protein